VEEWNSERDQENGTLRRYTIMRMKCQPHQFLGLGIQSSLATSLPTDSVAYSGFIHLS